ncbi:hypothetical protein CONCODRAFT_78507 [Conidiobolus coronatus NRRL 28638]|uniref:Amino acid transporter transmembrane domain-containing protein n=1 Tax=Conidiobolus coronatus (strain ATCC 28846 / CBS 209.66 / NRRL 28638) TaxID=796925 RepID=A0A137P7X1_CONC2|nr:hypothetical protein CONCODRAFT_78507 [Conidiobolus coronatus NRRL 28638]|eukprot:KXN71113.1 hypothetical protein CONCODRAFT_78507 [Conidiobolus coronatus NRRL 28638]
MSDKKETFEIAEAGSSEHIKHGTGSSIGAYFTILCALAGTGTLGLPQAVAKSGWVGVLLIILGALFAIYTGLKLVQVIDKKADAKIETYPDVGAAAFGLPGRILVQFCQYTIIGGGVTLYMVYSGGVMKNLALINGTEISIKYLIIVAGVIIWIPLVTFKKIQEVFFIGVFGALATLVAVILVVVLGFIDLSKFESHGAFDDVVWENVPLSLSTICFAYGGTVVFPQVYRSMAKPQQWPVVVTTSTLSAFAFYVLTAVVGYYVYGREVKSPIFESLPKGAPNLAGQVLMMIHVLAAGVIFLCSLSLELERYFKITVEHMGRGKEFAIRAVARTSILALLVLIGCFVPYFGDLMSLVGAFSECMLVFVVPLTCHLKIFGIRGRPIYEYVWIAILYVVAAVCVVMGTIDAIKALIHDVKTNPV